MTPPYKRLTRAVTAARTQFPDATDVKPVWTPNGEHDICVEVWNGPHARVLPVANGKVVTS